MIDSLTNKQNISAITMYPIAICKCAIGQDWYTNKFTVEFVPDKCYPDYMEVDIWLNENIRGQELNIEDAVDLFGNYLMEYDPAHLTVTVDVTNVLTHFPVRVSKTYK